MLISENLNIYDRLEGGKIIPTFKDVNLNRFMKEFVGGMRRNASKKRVTINHDIEQTLPTVQMDAMLVRIALSNIVDNAIKFSPGGESVTIRVRFDNKGIYIHVDDNGPGIEAADRVRIFAKYQQAGATPVRALGSSGLGLFIADTFVKMARWHNITP